MFLRSVKCRDCTSTWRSWDWNLIIGHMICLSLPMSSTVTLKQPWVHSLPWYLSTCPPLQAESNLWRNCHPIYVAWWCTEILQELQMDDGHTPMRDTLFKVWRRCRREGDVKAADKLRALMKSLGYRDCYLGEGRRRLISAGLPVPAATYWTMKHPILLPHKSIYRQLSTWLKRSFICSRCILECCTNAETVAV